MAAISKQSDLGTMLLGGVMVAMALSLFKRPEQQEIAEGVGEASAEIGKAAAVGTQGFLQGWWDELMRYERDPYPVPNLPKPAVAETEIYDGRRVYTTYKRLAKWVRDRGFVVTDSIASTGHNEGSKHYIGLAVDVRTRDVSPEKIAIFIRKAQAAGISVVDERTKPAGQKVWSGPHLHLYARNPAWQPPNIDYTKFK